MTSRHRRVEPVGRDDECSRLAAVAAAARRGQGDAVVLTGPPGSGRSTLLRRTTEVAARAGTEVLDATGSGGEAELPYGGLQQLLGPVLDRRAPDRCLPGQACTVLWRVLGTHPTPGPGPLQVGVAALALLDALAAREGGLLVTVDDVHRLDDQSKHVLAFLARRTRGRHLAVVLSAATGPAADSSDSTPAGLPRIQLEPLPDLPAAALLDAVRHAHGVRDPLPDPVRRALLALAAGLPLALVELARTAPPEDPGTIVPGPALQEALVAGFDRLEPTGREMLLDAALGECIDPDAKAITDLGTTVLDQAQRRGLVQIDVYGVARWAHPLVPAAIRARTALSQRQTRHRALALRSDLPESRRLLHAAISRIGHDDALADALERTHAAAHRSEPSTAELPTWMLARAAQLTSDPARRGRRLVRAAEDAAERGLSRTVVDLGAAAERCPLDHHAALRLQQARDLLEDGLPGDPARILELCADADWVTRRADPDLARRLLGAAATRCWWSDPGIDSRRLVLATADALGGAGQDARCTAAIAVVAPASRASEVVDALARVPPDADHEDLRWWGAAAHAVGDEVRAADLLARVGPMLRAQGRLALLARVRVLQATATTATGDWATARAAADEGLSLAEQTGQPLWRLSARVAGAHLDVLTGRPGAAADVVTDIEKTATSRASDRHRADAVMLRGLVAAATGRAAAAYQTLAALYAPFDTDDPDQLRHHHRRLALATLADAAHTAGLTDRVRPLVDQISQSPDAQCSRLLHLQWHYAAAVLASDADTSAAFALARRADLSRWPWLRARLDLAEGSWRRRHRRIADSRVPLRSAADLLDALGAAAGRRARDELAASDQLGCRTGHPRLSFQENRIAQLAGEGLTNREIGQRLDLSPRTVGSHLSRIFPKLDITSRGQLIDRLMA